MIFTMQGQQEAFNREAGILWNFATTTKEFAFKIIQGPIL
jgi:hypothetical protein